MFHKPPKDKDKLSRQSSKNSYSSTATSRTVSRTNSNNTSHANSNNASYANSDDELPVVNDSDIQSSLAFTKCGRDLYHLGKLEYAVETFRRAIELYSNNTQALNGLGLAYKAQQNYEAAITQFILALQCDPTNTAILNNRGISYKALGHLDRAYSDFTAAIVLDTTYVKAYVNRSIILALKSNYNDAISDCNIALAIEPTNLQALNNRGTYLKAQGKIDDALADFDAACKLNPNYSRARESYDATLLERNQALKKRISTPAPKPPHLLSLASDSDFPAINALPLPPLPSAPDLDETMTPPEGALPTPPGMRPR